jgi:hypothetical protein
MNNIAQSWQYSLKNNEVTDLDVSNSKLKNKNKKLVSFNADKDKSRIFSSNKDKSGVYMWTNLKTNEKYIGSAIDLAKELKDYYRIFSNKISVKNSRIYTAILSYGYSSFSLTILEFINIHNLDKAEASKLISKRKRHFMNTLKPEYNKKIISKELTPPITN